MSHLTKISSYKGNTISPAVDILVKKHHDGKLSWALPSLGLVDTYSKSYLADFMEVRKLTYKIVVVTEEILN